MHVSYKTHIASLYYIENFSTYVVSRRSRSPPLSGTFERQGQTSFPAKCVQLHVLIWYCSACRARDVHVLRACCTSEPVQTGSNRFKLVQTGKNREKPRKQVHREQWRLTCAFPFPRGRHLPLCDMRGDIDHNVTYMETLTAM